MNELMNKYSYNCLPLFNQNIWIFWFLSGPLIFCLYIELWEVELKAYMYFVNLHFIVYNCTIGFIGFQFYNRTQNLDFLASNFFFSVLSLVSISDDETISLFSFSIIRTCFSIFFSFVVLPLRSFVSLMPSLPSSGLSTSESSSLLVSSSSSSLIVFFELSMKIMYFQQLPCNEKYLRFLTKNI